MPFVTYWNRATFQNGGGSDGLVNPGVSGPSGSKAVAGGAYVTRYPDEGLQVLPTLPAISGFPILKSIPHSSLAESWTTQVAVPDGVPVAVHCWVTVEE